MGVPVLEALAKIPLGPKELERAPTHAWLLGNGGDSMTHLRVKNWGRFQQYKDRTPPWIKLHTDLLDNYEFSALPDASKAHLILIWVLASKVDNKIPARPDWIATKIFATEPVDLELLIEAGFLEYGDGSNWRANWASRYVSNKVKTQLLQEASHQCLACGSPDNHEFR